MDKDSEVREKIQDLLRKRYLDNSDHMMEVVEEIIALTKREPQNTAILYPAISVVDQKLGIGKVEPQIEGLELTPEAMYLLTHPLETYVEKQYLDYWIKLSATKRYIAVAQAAVKKAKPIIRAKAYKEGWRKGDQFGIDSATEVDDVILEASVRDAIQAERAKTYKWGDEYCEEHTPTGDFEERRRECADCWESHYKE